MDIGANAVGQRSDEVRALVAGDDFEAWVAPHLQAMSAVAARLVGRGDAADVVQNALLRAWRRWHTYSAERGAPRPWLMAILVDQARRHRVRRPSDVLLEDVDLADAVSRTDRALPTSHPDPERLDVEAALAALPRRQRQTVVLHYLADLGVREVATVLGISEGSVKTHLSAARARLRTVMEER